MTHNDIDALLSDPNTLPAEREALQALGRSPLPEHAPNEESSPDEATGAAMGIVEDEPDQHGNPTGRGKTRRSGARPKFVYDPNF